MILDLRGGAPWRTAGAGDPAVSLCWLVLAAEMLKQVSPTATKAKDQHSRFSFCSPAPVVSATRTIIPIHKASLNVWNWRQVGGGVG